MLTIKKYSIKKLSYCAIFVALMTICSWITIPTAVPFTLQTLGVFLTVGLLGGKLGTISVLVFVLLGAIGIPVFSGFSGGFGVIAGTSGGYIIGFIFSALVMWLIEYIFGSKLTVFIISMIIGLLVIYTFGTVWFKVVYTRQTGPVGIGAVLSWCVVPFIIPDIAKMVCATFIIKRLKKHVLI
ncbi:MAG: biotin transporter BioY [Ruminococcus sp.]|nr:biotin transporter BioY [Ruminococcus sp.]